MFQREVRDQTSLETRAVWLSTLPCNTNSHSTALSLHTYVSLSIQGNWKRLFNSWCMSTISSNCGFQGKYCSSSQLDTCRRNPAYSEVLVSLPLRALLQLHWLPENLWSVWMPCTAGTHQGQVPQILTPDFKPFHGHSAKQYICDIFCSRLASVLTYSRLEMGNDGKEK